MRRNNAECVDIQSVSLVIKGSDIVQTLQLNERVEFNVACRFTHSEGKISALSLQPTA